MVKGQGSADYAPKPRCRREGKHEVTDISLDLGGGCNLSCSYCFEKDIATRSGPMSRETSFQAIDFLLRASGTATRLAVHFGSGELLMNFSLMKDLVEYRREKASALGKTLGFHLTTNGILLDEKIAAFLEEDSFRLRISLDGPPRYHDGHRTGVNSTASSPEVLKGISLLPRKIKKDLIINTVFARGMVLYDIYQWARNQI